MVGSGCAACPLPPQPACTEHTAVKWPTFSFKIVGIGVAQMLFGRGPWMKAVLGSTGLVPSGPQHRKHRRDPSN